MLRGSWLILVSMCRLYVSLYASRRTTDVRVGCGNCLSRRVAICEGYAPPLCMFFPTASIFPAHSRTGCGKRLGLKSSGPYWTEPVLLVHQTAVVPPLSMVLHTTALGQPVHCEKACLHTYIVFRRVPEGGWVHCRGPNCSRDHLPLDLADGVRRRSGPPFFQSKGQMPF